MCEALTMRPRAIYPYELSNRQLSTLFRLDPRLIVSAWRTSEGHVVYMEGPKPNAYIWQAMRWVPLNEDAQCATTTTSD
jgi:hypothetical protein